MKELEEREREGRKWGGGGREVTLKHYQIRRARLESEDRESGDGDNRKKSIKWVCVLNHYYSQLTGRAFTDKTSHLKKKNQFSLFREGKF